MRDLVDVDTESGGVAGVERVLGIDERGDAARRLSLGDDLQCKRRLAGRLGAVDLDDATTRNTTDAERRIERERAGRNRGDLVSCACSPSFMSEPLPNFFSIWASAIWVLSRSLLMSCLAFVVRRANPVRLVMCTVERGCHRVDRDG